MLLPLKQGLKLQPVILLFEKSSGCYATSIKTRIETARSPHHASAPRLVVMLLPLKQGLKLPEINHCIYRTTVVMLLPLKQGLKHQREDFRVGALLLLCYFH